MKSHLTEGMEVGSAWTRQRLRSFDEYYEQIDVIEKFDEKELKLIWIAVNKNSLDYADKNGVQIYGVVATGHVRELLKLQEASFVKAIRIGELRLWIGIKNNAYSAGTGLCLRNRVRSCLTRVKWNTHFSCKNIFSSL